MKSAIGNDGKAFSASTPALASQAIASAITEYLVANVKVNVSYKGAMIVSGAPDPIIADVFKIAGAIPTIASGGSFEAFVSNMQIAIASAFIVVPPGEKGVVTALAPFALIDDSLNISQDSLKNAHRSNYDNPQQAVWERVCEGVMNWINGATFTNPAAIVPIPATRPGQSAGTANIISIQIS